MSPKEPEPIFRTSLYLPPTMNSALEPLLLAMAKGATEAGPGRGRARGGAGPRRGGDSEARRAPPLSSRPGGRPLGRLCPAAGSPARREAPRGPLGHGGGREGSGRRARGPLAPGRHRPRHSGTAAAILSRSRRSRGHKMPPARGRCFFTARGTLGAGRGAPPRLPSPRACAEGAGVGGGREAGRGRSPAPRLRAHGQ